MSDHDVPYFRGILLEQTTRLKELCKDWQDISSSKNVPEDVCGEIRTAIGLTELLMDQRFKQFSGLVDDCEYQRGKKKTMCEDLQGFWDMIYQEVEKVDKKFFNLAKLKANDWEVKQDCKPAQVIKKKPVLGKKFKQESAFQAKASSNARAYILAARQKLAEAKAQKKAAENDEETKENVCNISINVQIKAPVEKKAKGDSANVSKGRRAKNKVPQDFIPLACVTRSAARALKSKNQPT